MFSITASASCCRRLHTSIKGDFALTVALIRHEREDEWTTLTNRLPITSLPAWQ